MLWEEVLLANAWQCQWSLMVILHAMPLTNPLGKLKEACTFWASSWWLSTSEILAGSGCQSGILCAHACQVTHLSYLSTGGSGEDLFPSYSSKLLAGSWRKWSTSGPNFAGGSRSKSRRGSLASPSSPDPEPHQEGLYSKKGTELSSGQTLWHLLLHCWDPLLQQSWLQVWAWASGQPQVMDQLSLPIFSSKAAAVARALWWASLTSVRFLSAEVPLLPLLGVLLLGGWMSAGPGSSKPHSGLPSFCLRQCFREDTTSAVSLSICSSPHGGDPGSLLSLYTW